MAPFDELFAMTFVKFEKHPEKSKPQRDGFTESEVGITLGAQNDGWKIQEIKKNQTPRIRLEKLKTKSPPRRYCY